MSFDNNLWGKVFDLHERYKRQNNNLDNIIYLLTQFQNVLFYYGKDLQKAVNKNYTLFEEKNTTQNILLEALNSHIKLQGEIFSQKYNEINEHITQPSKNKFKNLKIQEEEDYNNFKEAQKLYENIMEKLQNSEKNYQKYLKIAEENTKKYVESKLNNEYEMNILINEQESDNSLSNANFYETEYINNVNKARELNNNYNCYQRIYLQNYYTLNFQIGTSINSIIMLFISSMKDLLGNIITDIDILSEKVRKINIEEDISDYINQNKSNLKPEENIIFQYYQPKTILNFDSLNPALDYEVIKIMKSRLKTVFLNFNENEEKDIIEYRIIYSKLFNDSIKLNENEIEKVKISLQKQKNRIFFLTFLSNQRKEGKYVRKKEIIEIIALILNEILNIIEKENDFFSVKNTILLSQTFYYENDDKKKIYVEEFIKNHHWVKTFDFWKNLIDYMIKEELKRQFQENKINIEEKKEEEKQKIISTVCFTQLISYANVMQQFEIDKNQIVELIKIFINKYSIEQKYIEQIYEVINYQN